MEKQRRAVARQPTVTAPGTSPQPNARATQGPPPYSGPSVAGPSSAAHTNHEEEAVKAFPQYPGLAKLDYRLYKPPLFTLSSDSTTLSSKAEYLSNNATALLSLIRAQSTVPPKPQIRVRGTRARGRRVDFDVKLNLMSLLVPENADQRIDYIRCVSDDELAFRGGSKPDTQPLIGDAGLTAWCERYTRDTASLKSFALDRVVVNLDFSWLEGQLRSLVASLGYQGAVEVNLVITHSRVIVQNPDKVNSFLTSVTSLFTGKNKYEVVKAVWPVATTRSGDAGRRCVVQSEEAWWRDWRDPIRHAISQGRQGWVTIEDRYEALMEGKGSSTGSIDWGPGDDSRAF